MSAGVRIAVCVDDTDDLTKEMSTGKIADAIAAELHALGGRVELGITRHQLLLDDRIAYTSHNSSMAFTAQVPIEAVELFREHAVGIVKEMRSAASDPGLCTALIPVRENTLLHELVNFGVRAKTEYFTKGDAYELAHRIPWVELTEHGGTGVGVIGALAGIGLRLGGNDGRFRGSYDLAALCGADPGVSALPVDEALQRLECALGGPVGIATDDGAQAFGRQLELAANVKAIYHAGAFTLVARADGATLRPMDKRAFKDAGSYSEAIQDCCPLFEFDNDREEFIDASGSRSCANCLYRRLTARGFVCVRTTPTTPPRA